MARRPDPQRQRGDEDQRQRRAGEQQGGRQVVQQVVQHRPPGGIREAEVQVQRPPQPVQILHRQRLVEPQQFAGRGDHLFRGRQVRQAQIIQRRVAGAEPQQQKDDGGGGEQQRDQQQQAA